MRMVKRWGWIPLTCLLAVRTSAASEPSAPTTLFPTSQVSPGAPAQLPPSTHEVPPFDPAASHGDSLFVSEPAACGCCQERRLFESDHAFDGFVGPISNPILSKDPRSLTEARALFVHNQIDSDHLFGGGDFQSTPFSCVLPLPSV